MTVSHDYGRAESEVNDVMDLWETARRAARTVAAGWPGVIEAGDLEQEIMVRLLESPGSVDKILESSQRARFGMVVRIGHQIASQERVDYDHFSGRYRYSVKEAKDLLRSGALTSERTEFSAAELDLVLGLQSLEKRHPPYADAILSRYLDGKTGTWDKEFDNALSRAHEALANEMNRVRRTDQSEHHDGPGSRRTARHGSSTEEQERNW